MPYKAIVAATLLAAASSASAERVFFDDFNTEAGGKTAFRQQKLNNWNISLSAVDFGGGVPVPGGFIDVIAPVNPQGYKVNSTVIDLGGGLTGGFMTMKEAVNYAAGDLVQISWDMAGNQIKKLGEDIPYIQFLFGDIKNDEGYVEVENLDGTEFFDFLGNYTGRIYQYYFAYSYGLFGDYAFTRQTISFRAVESGNFRFQLGTLSGGGYGPLIDNFAIDLNPTGGISTRAGVAAVPEPASWALMIAGFGLAGGAMRRRRALVAA